jgi:hypothetical protein
MNYLEMKYNMILSYNINLVYFILLKLHGKSTKEHPILDELLHHNAILQKLEPLDAKLQYQIDKIMRLQFLQASPMPTENRKRKKENSIDLDDTGIEFTSNLEDNQSKLKYKPNPHLLEKVTPVSSNLINPNNKMVKSSSLKNEKKTSNKESEFISDTKNEPEIYRPSGLNPVYFSVIKPCIC